MGKDWFEREHAEVERLSGVLEPRARTLFTFLRHEGGFTQRPSTRRESILWTQLIYRSAELGVEIEIDYTLRLIAVWLIRLEQGKYPVAAGPFSGPVNGVVIRPRLETVLRDQLNVADPILDELERLRRDSEREQRDQAFLERMLDLYQQLFQRHLAAILQHPLAQLFPAGIVDRACIRIRCDASLSVGS